MNQWIDESSRDHHYQASINTFIRKYIVGLESGTRSGADPSVAAMDGNAWAVVRVRPAPAALLNTTLLQSNVSLATRRGEVSAWWAFPRGSRPVQPPAPPSDDAPLRECFVVPQFPVPAGGLVAEFRTIEVGCPAGETIASVVYAVYGKPDFNNAPWRCFGPQPVPRGTCQADVSSNVAQLCVGKQSCTLTASSQMFGNPCSLRNPDTPPPGGPQLAVRIQCSGNSSTSAEHRRSAPPSPSRLTDATMNCTSSSLQPIFSLTVSVPYTSSGEIHVPLFVDGPDEQLICEGGQVVFANGAFVPGVQGVLGGAVEDGFVRFSTTSGDFVFTV